MKGILAVSAIASVGLAAAISGCQGKPQQAPEAESAAAEQSHVALDVPEEYENITDLLIDDSVKSCLAYLVTPQRDSGFTSADRADTHGVSYEAGSGSLVGYKVDIRVWYDEEDKSGEKPAEYVELLWRQGSFRFDVLGDKIQDVLGSVDSERTSTSRTIPIPLTDLAVYMIGFDGFDGSSIYITRPSEESSEELDAYVSAADLPDALGNQGFKNALGLLSAPFSQTGIDPSAGRQTDAGTTIFELDGIEFLGESDWSESNFPRVVYKTEGLQSGEAAAKELVFTFFNHLDGNGYDDAVEMVGRVSDALGLKSTPEIENDYSPSDLLADGTYCTLNFKQAGFTLRVEGSDSFTQVVFTPNAS